MKMMMKRLCKPTFLFLAALASGVAFLPVSAQSNSDWLRRQQQQQQQQQQMRQQQELQRQQQLQQQRQQMQQQMRQQQQQQMREQMQQQQRQQMQQQLRQQQQMQQRRQVSEASVRAGAQRRGGRAAGADASIVSKRNDRVLYSNGVAKLTRPPTPGEMRRGFTGKVTQDGRALVKINGRVFAVPAARIGAKVNRSPSMGRPQASQWSASKRASISAAVQRLASANLRNRVRTGGGGGGRRPPGGGGGDDGKPPTNGVKVQFGADANQVSHAFRHIDKAGLDREKVKEAIQTDLAKISTSLPKGRHYNGSVHVNGRELIYSALKLPDGTINVGRITPRRR